MIMTNDFKLFPVSVIDLGTHNCRMLVAKFHEKGFSIIDSFSRITRLGEGVSSQGVLAESAMDRTVNALKYCAKKIKSNRVVLSRSVATEACRRASNCEIFVERVMQETGISLEIISPFEEAKLAVRGCESLIHDQNPYALIFDIGGGSTEVTLVEVLGVGKTKLIDFISIPVGVVTVAEDCGGGDFSERTFTEIATKVERLLTPFETQYSIVNKIKTSEVQMIGTSGTVTTLGAIDLGLLRYDRRLVDSSELKFSSIFSHGRDLCNMTMQERAASPCIGWERAELVLSGCAILEAICNLWPVGNLKIADRGLREGILCEMQDQLS
jgi:exopolyphosphatase/guanosine-5'-triphosphate,3'-diphosphate pyrophosphatase